MFTKTIEVADDYWSAEFGCERTELRPRTPRVQRHAGRLKEYTGALIFVSEAAPLVSVPSALVDAVALRADEFVAEAVRDAGVLTRLLTPGTVTKVVGPARLEYADGSCFAPSGSEGTRELLPGDEAPFLELRATCPPEDWEPKEFALGVHPTFGAFTPLGELAAVANIRVWQNSIAHISVIARPDLRGQGFGPRAVTAATARALELGLLPQYRVLESNAPSRRVASKLGFQSYGWMVAVRLA